MTFKQDGDYFGSYNNPNIRRRELMRHSLRDADAVSSLRCGRIAVVQAGPRLSTEDTAGSRLIPTA